MGRVIRRMGEATLPAWSQTSLLLARPSAHPFGTWGQGGLGGLIPEVLLSWEEDGGQGHSEHEARGPLPSLSQSAGRAGLLELPGPLPISKAGGPMSSLGLRDVQGGRSGLRQEPKAPGHLAY